MVDGQPQRLEMIGKVTEDFWFTDDENGNLEKGVYKKVES
jgi:hypothetical protein